MGFIDTMRSQGHAVESICRVLREQDCQIAARTYRSWKRAGRVVAARTVSDAHVVDAVRDIAWTDKVNSDGLLVRRLSPEGLYGRRKMTAYLRRTVMPEASAGSVDRAMRTLGLSGVRRDKGIRTTIPAKNGKRAGDLLDRDFTAAAPNLVWVTDFQCRHRHWKSYADLRTMPMFLTTGCSGTASGPRGRHSQRAASQARMSGSGR